MAKAIWILASVFALTAGIIDLGWRKIPNWLTYSAMPLAILLNSIAGGRRAALLSLEGALLGLGLLLPFVLMRSLGGGDWKLVGALGAFFGAERLLPILMLTLIINAVIALGLIVTRRRIQETVTNLGRMLMALAQFRLPGPELTIDNPQAAKVPFGVAAAIAVVFYAATHPWALF